MARGRSPRSPRRRGPRRGASSPTPARRRRSGRRPRRRVCVVTAGTRGAPARRRRRAPGVGSSSGRGRRTPVPMMFSTRPTPAPVRCKTLVFRDSDSVWSIRRRASMCRYASLVLQTPLRFRAAATASTHQLCSGSLTGGSAATCTRHDVAATASCNAAARRPGARPRRLARRPGWRAAGQSRGAGRRRAHGDAAESADCAAGQNLRVASYNVLSSKLCEPGYFMKCAKENLDPPTRLKRVPGSTRTGNEKERRRLPPGGLEGVERRPPRVLRAAGLPVHDGVVRQPHGRAHKSSETTLIIRQSLWRPSTHWSISAQTRRAWPQDKYDLVTIDCARLSDDVQEAKQKWEKREEITGIRKLASNLKTRLKNVVSALTSS